MRHRIQNVAGVYTHSQRIFASGIQPGDIPFNDAEISNSFFFHFPLGLGRADKS